MANAALRKTTFVWRQIQMKARTKAILNELKTKVGLAGKAAFDRLGLAAELLQDGDWVAEKGSIKNAHRVLQSDFFGDLCLAAKLETLLEIRKTFNTEKEWQERKWDLQMLYAEMKERQDADKPVITKRSATVKELEAMTEQKNDLEVEKQHLVQTLEQEKRSRVEESDRLKEENRRLAEENARLRDENSRLKGRLEEIDRMRQQRVA